MSEKKYYWLKLKDDFFERKDIKIIESMDNGKDYIIFLLKLKLRSITDEGYLRVSEKIPYNEKMLSTITGVDIDIVRSAMKVFVEFGLIEIMDDRTIYMSCVEKLIGNETGSAKRMREMRAHKQLEAPPVNNVTEPLQKRDGEIDIELDKEIEIDKKKEPDPNISLIIKYWNDHDLLKCEKVTPVRVKIIEKVLKAYALDIIKDCIHYYDEAINDSTYFESYKWSLDNFFTRKRGYTSWMKEGEKWQAYINWFNSPEQKKKRGD